MLALLAALVFALSAVLGLALAVSVSPLNAIGLLLLSLHFVWTRPIPALR